MSAPAQLSLPWRERAERSLDTGVHVPAPPTLHFVRNGRARRYILRVLPDASVRVTIPRRGSQREAEAFLRTRAQWIDERRRELETSTRPTRWRAGQWVWWRGEHCVLEVVPVTAGTMMVRCGELCVTSVPRDDYRPLLEPLMRGCAADLLPARVRALASAHGLVIARVSIRNQRSRWGSCSRDGNIALNWRLVQMPAAVSDYVLLHELMHLREPNHSPRFWALVEAVCPDYAPARAWLRAEGLALC